MRIEITKNDEQEKRTYLKGQVLDVMPWKAAEMVKANIAKVLFKNIIEVEKKEVETNEAKLVKETR